MRYGKYQLTEDMAQYRKYWMTKLMALSIQGYGKEGEQMLEKQIISYLYYYRRSVLKIGQISSRAGAIRQRSWRRFSCAYMLPISDLCATAFCVLLSFVFYENK